jgi:hypothetical protein
MKPDARADYFLSSPEIEATIALRAKSLSANQRLIIYALLKNSSSVSPGVFKLIARGLGFSLEPDLSSPIISAVLTISEAGKSVGYKREDMQDQFVLLRALGQLGDFLVGINFVNEISIVLNSFAVSMRPQ